MKKYLLIVVSLLFLPFFLVGCGEKQQLSSYKIDVVFDDENKEISCEQEVEYVNNSSNVLDEVCFFLYANAFMEGQNPVTNTYLNKAYPNGESFGEIEIYNVMVENQIATFEISEEQNILTVNLDCDIFPGEVVNIKLDYVVVLANINHRLGYGENSINFGNFFPIACVYEDGVGFVKNQFSSSGDPFYSEVSNFDVNITFPNTFVLASTGVVVETFEQQGLSNAHCKANNVRDFCFVLSQRFEKTVGKAGDVDVIYYFYDDENSEAHFKTAVDAVLTFEKLFGKYPYQNLSVVKTNFCFGGMEYPNLVMISDSISENEVINYVIVHEIAHQWWYGMVGNNEFEDSWVDEGLTEFSTALFFENNTSYGMNYDQIMTNATDNYKNFVKIYSKILGDVDESMDRNLTEFNTEPEYVNCIYTKGMLLFDHLRRSMTDQKFFKCLRDYFNRYKFLNSSSQALIDSFCKSSHTNLEGFFASWINGEVVFQ